MIKVAYHFYVALMSRAIGLKRVILGEGCLRVNNQPAHRWIMRAGLDCDTAV
jgi:hypothetical protein